VAQEISHLAFDILRDPYRTLPFHVPDDLRHRILRRYRYQHVNMIGHPVALLDPVVPDREILGPSVLIPGEAARYSGMKPPTDSEMISPAIPR
jgi:hypothetical protein